MISIKYNWWITPNKPQKSEILFWRENLFLIFWGFDNPYSSEFNWKYSHYLLFKTIRGVQSDNLDFNGSRMYKNYFGKQLWLSYQNHPFWWISTKLQYWLIMEAHSGHLDCKYQLCFLICIRQQDNVVPQIKKWEHECNSSDETTWDLDMNLKWIVLFTTRLIWFCLTKLR